MKNKQPLVKTDVAGSRLANVNHVFLGACLLVMSLLLITATNAYAQAEDAEPAQVTERQLNQYGPLTRADSIWVIANRIHPDRSVSIYQTMVALVDLNAEVIVDDDINVLPVGAMLKLPTANQIRATNAELARKRMIPKLGGSLADIAFDFTDEQLEQRTAELAVVASDLEAANRRANRLESELTDVQARYRDLQEEHSALEAAVMAARAEAETAQAEVARLTAAEQSRSSGSQLSTVWQEYSQNGWLLAIAVLVVLILLTAILFSRRKKDEDTDAAPYPKAAARYLSERSDVKKPAAEKAQSDEQADAATTDEPAAAKQDFRDIDEIIDEAEADADADSDVDAGQTAEEAAQAEREELAAQIDLARAYLEMGELDEAIAALEEVMPMADAELQKEAEALFTKVTQQQSKE